MLLFLIQAPFSLIQLNLFSLLVLALGSNSQRGIVLGAHHREIGFVNSAHLHPNIRIQVFGLEVWGLNRHQSGQTVGLLGVICSIKGRVLNLLGLPCTESGAELVHVALSPLVLLLLSLLFFLLQSCLEIVQNQINAKDV